MTICYCSTVGDGISYLVLWWLLLARFLHTTHILIHQMNTQYIIRQTNNNNMSNYLVDSPKLYIGIVWILLQLMVVTIPPSSSHLHLPEVHMVHFSSIPYIPWTNVMSFLRSITFMFNFYTSFHRVAFCSSVSWTLSLSYWMSFFHTCIQIWFQFLSLTLKQSCRLLSNSLRARVSKLFDWLARFATGIGVVIFEKYE